MTRKPRIHRMYFDIKQVTIVKQAGKWYAIATCNILRRKHSAIFHTRPVRIDVGITNYAHDSDGNNVKNPLFLSKNLKPLRKAQRKVSRRVRCSSK